MAMEKTKHMCFQGTGKLNEVNYYCKQHHGFIFNLFFFSLHKGRQRKVENCMFKTTKYTNHAEILAIEFQFLTKGNHTQTTPTPTWACLLIT